MEKPLDFGGCPLKCQGKPNGLASLGDPPLPAPMALGVDRSKASNLWVMKGLNGIYPLVNDIYIYTLHEISGHIYIYDICTYDIYIYVIYIIYIWYYDTPQIFKSMFSRRVLVRQYFVGHDNIIGTQYHDPPMFDYHPVSTETLK